MFEPFPKLTRFTHDWTVTEKIDGTNGQVLVIPKTTLGLTDGGSGLGIGDDDQYLDVVLAEVGDLVVLAGSRNRLLGLGKQDNHGFAQFVQDNAAALVETLGEGRHFGEWYGAGLGRKYGLNHKRFALFNAGRWTGVDLPERVDVVPTLFQGFLADSSQFDICLAELQQMGSRIAPNFMNPEGIVMYHGPSRTAFKRTFEYDEAGKWAENQERKA